MPPSSSHPPSGTEGENPIWDDSGLCNQTANPSARRGRPSIAEAEQLSGKILDASWEVLLAEGFESFTFDRVARHARIGKATIYSRFASKFDLMLALLQRRTLLRREFIMAQGAGLPFADALFVRAVEISALLTTPDGKLLERLVDWLDHEKGNPPQAGVRAQIWREARDQIARSFAEASARGEVSMRDFAAASQFWLECLLGHARMLDSQGTVPREAHECWAREFIRFFLFGVTRQD